MKLNLPNSERWTKEECRTRYIEDEKISLKAVSILSNVPKPTLEKWSKDGNWMADKKEFHKDLAKKAASQKLVDELSKLATDSYKAHYQLLAYAAQVINYKVRDLANIERLPEHERLEYLKTEHNPYDMDAWSRIISRATQGIAQATGLQSYIDINAAIKRLEKDGYGIIDISSIKDDIATE